MWRRVRFWCACSRASRGETRNTCPRPRAARQPDQTPAVAGQSHTLPTPADFRSRAPSRFHQTATPWMRPGTAVPDSLSPYYVSPSRYYLVWPPPRKRFSSSVRWRSVRPASVFECAMPQSARIRPALTEPIFGSAKRRSRTLAVRRHSGGWARICASSIFPDARSFFSCALADRISLASCRARRRCSRDLPGTLAFALPADTRAILGTAPGGR